MHFCKRILAVALCLVSTRQCTCFQTGQSLAKPFVSLNGQFGPVQCIKQCLLRRSCAIAEYNRRYLQCTLGDTQEIVKVDDVLSMTLNKLNMAQYQDSLGACAHHNCPVGTKCIESRSTSLCVFDVCPTTWKMYRNHCYFFSNKQMTWDEAKIECKRMNSSLIKINDLEEYSWLKTIDSGFLWLGGNDKEKEGTWIWDMDSSKIDLKLWRDNEPSDKNGNENCMLAEADSKCNDNPCDVKQKYVCENH